MDIDLAVVITRPYYLDYKFGWGIEPFDGGPNPD